MNRELQIDNYVVDAEVSDILNKLKFSLTNGKLKDIKVKEDDITITCPIHSGGHEADPDCHINITKNPKLPVGYFHCFACGATGNFVKFVAECLDSTEAAAKLWILNNFNYHIAYAKMDLGDDIVIGKKKSAGSAVKKLDKSVLNQYQSWCPYLGKRKLTREICEKFQVKYDPYHRQIVFPCFDEFGNLIMLPTRSIDSKVFYLNKDVDKPVYLLDNIIRNHITKCMVVEGPIDALTGNMYGVPTIATLGAVSDSQIEKINHSGIQILYAMFDNDQAGRRFTETVRQKLSKNILFIDIKIPNPYKDINDMDYKTFLEVFKKYQ